MHTIGAALSLLCVYCEYAYACGCAGRSVVVKLDGVNTGRGCVVAAVRAANVVS